MRPLLLGMLCAATATAAAAREPQHSSVPPREAAATDCFAESIGNNPAALAHARSGRWYEAAGVIGYLCRPEVDAMMRDHDLRHGPGTGARYFRGAYTRHLAQSLEERLKPMLETKAWANAEPRPDAEPASAKP
ncbi:MULTISPECIES: hypothetical protein [unclassified Methylobacterium]